MSEAARKAVAAIISDLEDRKGIGNEWDAIDPDIQDEIMDAWEEHIDAAFVDRDHERG